MRTGPSVQRYTLPKALAKASAHNVKAITEYGKGQGKTAASEILTYLIIWTDRKATSTPITSFINYSSLHVK